MKAAPKQREKLVQRWRNESEVKLLSVQVANQFLHGFNPEQSELHLVSFERDVLIVWYTVTVLDQGPLPFMGTILHHKQELLSIGIKVLDYGFVRTLSAHGNELIGEIGFQIQPNDVRKIPNTSRHFTTREIPHQLFATLEHKIW